jgi:hypothetical protein
MAFLAYHFCFEMLILQPSWFSALGRVLLFCLLFGFFVTPDFPS